MIQTQPLSRLPSHPDGDSNGSSGGSIAPRSLFRLATHAMRKLVGRRHRTHIRCTRGQAWLTQTGDGRDIFLNAGDTHQCMTSGELLISALEDAVLIVETR